MNSFLLLIILFCCCKNNHHDDDCDHGWGSGNVNSCSPVCHGHSKPSIDPCPSAPCTPAAGARNQFFMETQPRTCGCECEEQ